MKVCFSEEMRRIDALAIEKFNIPGIVLMENAASACVLEIKHFDTFTVVCGRGNNGGDGLAIARRLIIMGKKVNIYLALGDAFSGDALINYNILKAMGVKFKDTQCGDFEKDLLTSDCVVDAILGTGIKGEIKSPVAEIIEKINKNSRYILSVDVPSGINADSGEAECAVRADKTVTFAAYKTGMLLYPAANFTGEIVVADISIPPSAFEDININTIDEEYAKRIMPKRKANSHKGDYGKIFIIGGSCGMAGAVTLAAKAAFRVGAGIVTACVPEEINDVVQKSCIEAMTYPVDFEKDADKIASKMKGYDAILFGNGIGREEYVSNLLQKVLETSKVPVVIDADGLFALSKNLELLKRCKCPVILTPHSAEMGRLISKAPEDVEKDRLGVSRGFATEFGVALVLKGNHSIITAPCGTQYINLTGNNGMATAGSGDVLAGITAALAVTVRDVLGAASLAVYLHALAGDCAAETIGETSLVALDIVNALPQILPVETKTKV